MANPLNQRLRTTFWVRYTLVPVWGWSVVAALVAVVSAVLAIAPASLEGTSPGASTDPVETMVVGIAVVLLIAFGDGGESLRRFLDHRRDATTIGPAGLVLRSVTGTVSVPASSIAGFAVVEETQRMPPKFLTVFPRTTFRRDRGVLHAQLRDGTSVALPGIERPVVGTRWAGVRERRDDRRGWIAMRDASGEKVRWSASDDEAFFAMLTDRLQGRPGLGAAA